MTTIEQRLVPLTQDGYTIEYKRNNYAIEYVEKLIPYVYDIIKKYPDLKLYQEEVKDNMVCRTFSIQGFLCKVIHFTKTENGVTTMLDQYICQVCKNKNTPIILNKDYIFVIVKLPINYDKTEYGGDVNTQFSQQQIQFNSLQQFTYENSLWEDRMSSGFFPKSLPIVFANNLWEKDLTSYKTYVNKQHSIEDLYRMFHDIEPVEYIQQPMTNMDRKHNEEIKEMNELKEKRKQYLLKFFAPDEELLQNAEKSKYFMTLRNKSQKNETKTKINEIENRLQEIKKKKEELKDAFTESKKEINDLYNKLDKLKQQSKIDDCIINFKKYYTKSEESQLDSCLVRLKMFYDLCKQHQNLYNSIKHHNSMTCNYQILASFVYRQLIQQMSGEENKTIKMIKEQEEQMMLLQEYIQEYGEQYRQGTENVFEAEKGIIIDLYKDLKQLVQNEIKQHDRTTIDLESVKETILQRISKLQPYVLDNDIQNSFKKYFIQLFSEIYDQENIVFNNQYRLRDIYRSYKNDEKRIEYFGHIYDCLIQLLWLYTSNRRSDVVDFTHVDNKLLTFGDEIFPQLIIVDVIPKEVLPLKMHQNFEDEQIEEEQIEEEQIEEEQIKKSKEDTRIMRNDDGFTNMQAVDEFLFEGIELL